MDDQYIGWLAGLFEGEGCLQFNAKNSVSLLIRMTDEDIVRRCFEVTGFGNVSGPQTFADSRKPLWTWLVSRSDQVKELLIALLPWLGQRRGEKAKAAVLRVSLVRTYGECKRGHKMSGDNLYVSPKGRRSCRTCARERYHEFTPEQRERRRETKRQRSQRAYS